MKAGEVHSFCDGCQKLADVSQVKVLSRTKWFCSGCRGAVDRLALEAAQQLQEVHQRRQRREEQASREVVNA